MNERSKALRQYTDNCSVYEKKDKNRERKEIRRVVACNDVSFSESIIKEGREYVGTVGYIKQMRIPIDKEADGTDITVTEEDFEKNGSVRKPFIKNVNIFVACRSE